MTVLINSLFLCAGQKDKGEGERGRWTAAQMSAVIVVHQHRECCGTPVLIIPSEQDPHSYVTCDLEKRTSTTTDFSPHNHRSEH